MLNLRVVQSSACLSASWFMFVAAAASLVLVSGRAYAGPVNTAIYSSYSDNFPNGVNFSGAPVANISTADFQQFGSVVSWMWYPNGLTAFAADTVGYINVPTTASFTFIDDGVQDSCVFVDGVLEVSHGSDTLAANQNTFPLSAGIHTVEVQYDVVKPANLFPADIYSGWDLTISPGNGFSIVATPEPAALGLIAAGFVLLHRPRGRSAHLND